MNTEELHYLAYKKMCADRGFSLPWDMPTYIRHAMYNGTGPKEGICKEFPDLGPNWKVHYQEKGEAYAELLETRGVTLMPGVEVLLKELDRAGIKRCVVTHSSRAQIDMIRANQPILNSIPNWITREDYSEPKPSSECYLKAIEKLAAEGDRIVGFEDSPRGLQALLGTPAEAFLVTDLFSEDEVKALGNGFSHIPNFHTLRA